MSKMKKIYEAPDLEIESYELNAKIALNCGSVVHFGPGVVQSDGTLKNVCAEFEDPWAMALSVDTSFYELGTGTTCTCYYSAGGEGYFTS